MSKIDIHADDYGLTLNTSRDILRGINTKKLDSVSVIPNMSCYEEALKLWKQELKKGVEPDISVHLNFMEGSCCAHKQDVSLLVDEQGYFKISWIDLVKYNYNLAKYNEVKNQLKNEIRKQLWKVIDDYGLLEGKKLRVDSHQHTHMIPIVMKATLEVIEEENFSTEYIRISKEDLIPYLKKIKYYPSYSFVNFLKVAILNFFSVEDEKILKQKGFPAMVLSGVFMSGKMDIERVLGVLPELKKRAKKKNAILEVVLHPGTALQEEIGEEFVSEDANAFYLSPNRKIEYQTMMGLRSDMK